MKTIKMSKDYYDSENNTSIGGFYFEASMNEATQLNIQVNIREKELLTDEILSEINNELKDFVNTISVYGWEKVFSDNKNIQD